MSTAPQSAPSAVAGANNDAVSERYEDIVQRLSRVVEKLESGGLSLEDSIAAFEEGMRLSKLGAHKLEEAERRVEVLAADGRTQPLTDLEEAPR